MGAKVQENDGAGIPGSSRNEVVCHDYIDKSGRGGIGFLLEWFIRGHYFGQRWKQSDGLVNGNFNRDVFSGSRCKDFFEAPRSAQIVP